MRPSGSDGSVPSSLAHALSRSPTQSRGDTTTRGKLTRCEVDTVFSRRVSSRRNGHLSSNCACRAASHAASANPRVPSPSVHKPPTSTSKRLRSAGGRGLRDGPVIGTTPPVISTNPPALSIRRPCWIGHDEHTAPPTRRKNDGRGWQVQPDDRGSVRVHHHDIPAAHRPIIVFNFCTRVGPTRRNKAREGDRRDCIRFHSDQFGSGAAGSDPNTFHLR
jgi:hypothetical protein